MPQNVEAAFTQLLLAEITLAGQIESLKQELVKQYDYKSDLMYKELDDCLLGFIDCVAVKRFMTKCGFSVDDAVLIAIIRRLDMNADAKLSKDEFMDAVTPIEVKTGIVMTKV